MTIARRIGVCAITLGLAALVPSAAFAAQAPRKTVDRIAATQHEARVLFGDVHFFSDNPHLIDPCWYVRNDVYQKALSDANMRTRITLRYKSGGHFVVRVLTIAIKDARVVDSGSTVTDAPSNPGDYTHLISDFDLGANGVPDPGTPWEHSIEIYHEHDGGDGGCDHHDHDHDGDDDDDDA